MKSLKDLSDHQMVSGLPCIAETKKCEACSLGKQTRIKFPTGISKRAMAPLELVHGDVVGPVKTISIGSNSYFLLLTDDFSRYSWVYFLQKKKKSEVFQHFKQFKQLMETQLSRPLKVLRTDRGGEFTSCEFESFCKLGGVLHQLTAPRTPQQNGVAKHRNRTITEMARTMMKEKRLPSKYWAEAIAASVYIVNRSPTKALDFHTLVEALIGSKPHVDHLRVFGCLVYRHVDS